MSTVGDFSFLVEASAFEKHPALWKETKTHLDVWRSQISLKSHSSVSRLPVIPSESDESGPIASYPPSKESPPHCLSPRAIVSHTAITSTKNSLLIYILSYSISHLTFILALFVSYLSCLFSFLLFLSPITITISSCISFSYCLLPAFWNLIWWQSFINNFAPTEKCGLIQTVARSTKTYWLTESLSFSLSLSVSLILCYPGLLLYCPLLFWAMH